MWSNFVFIAPLLAFVKSLPTTDESAICRIIVPNSDFYYCAEKNITCRQCGRDTFIIGLCKVNFTDSDCQPCPFGTENEKPYHLDEQCVNSPTIDNKTPPYGPGTSQPSNKGRICTMHLLTYLTLLLFFLSLY